MGDCDALLWLANHWRGAPERSVWAAGGTRTRAAGSAPREATRGAARLRFSLDIDRTVAAVSVGVRRRDTGAVAPPAESSPQP